mgnify:CR=1 FL=1
MKFLFLTILLISCTSEKVDNEIEVPPAIEKSEGSGIPESSVSEENTGGCLGKSCFSGNAQIVFLPTTNQYELRSNGKAVGILPLSFDNEGGEMQKISLLKTRSQYVVIYQYGSVDIGSKVESFARHNLAKKWSLDVPGFNLGFATKGNALYVGVIDFAGKIDLKKGKYVWKQTGLFKKYDYNGPDYIRVYEKEVRFISGTKIIKMDKNTGKILP